MRHYQTITFVRIIAIRVGCVQTILQFAESEALATLLLNKPELWVRNRVNAIGPVILWFV